MATEKLENVRCRFWTLFVKKASAHAAFSGFNATPKKLMKHWLSVSHKNSVEFLVVCLKDTHWVEILIQNEHEESRRIFSILKDNADELRSGFGEPFYWDNHDNSRKRCKIMSEHYDYGHDNADMWDFIHVHLIDSLSRLQGAAVKIFNA